MATSTALSLTKTTPLPSPNIPLPRLHSLSFRTTHKPIRITTTTTRALSLDFDDSFFEEKALAAGLGLSGFDDDDLPLTDTDDDKPEIECPPGLRPYETMIMLKPDLSEDDRLAFCQRFEEWLVAGGAMYVQVYNRGVIPLAYEIEKRNIYDGIAHIYLDGLFLMFTYFTKPESINGMRDELKMDEDCIRYNTFSVWKRTVDKIRERKVPLESEIPEDEVDEGDEVVED